MKKDDLQRLDVSINWHPCSQMKDYDKFKPLLIEKAYGCYIELSNGKKIIDAVSSWWCKSLGHGHPDLKAALHQQLQKFEHVIFANTTHETIVKLSKQLSAVAPHIDKVFYAGDGSCAIEVALKMSLHARVIEGHRHRCKFISLKNAYHGETAATLSVSAPGIYRDAYTSILFEPIYINPVYVSSTDDPLWHDISDHWPAIEQQLEKYKETVTAVIFEPIVQGAAGMLLYSQDFLKRICRWAKKHNIHLIADEIMTGCGRTGKMLACEHASVMPDFICLSKGLTSGWLPFSAVLTTDAIYNLFYDDHDKNKSFLHSHTYSGNAMGASLALASLQIIERDNLCRRASDMQVIMRQYMHEVAERTGALHHIRGIGAIVAADLNIQQPGRRLAHEIFQQAIEYGALLRPLGDTLYWLPPLICSEDILFDLKEITIKAIQSVLSRK